MAYPHRDLPPPWPILYSPIISLYSHVLNIHSLNEPTSKSNRLLIDINQNRLLV